MTSKGPRLDEERREFWRAAVELHMESGLSVHEFCQREGLGQASFYAWRKRLAHPAEPAHQEAPRKGKLTKNDPEPSFVSVEIAADHAVATLVIELAGGTLRVGGDCSPTLLRTAVEALRC